MPEAALRARARGAPLRGSGNAAPYRGWEPNVVGVFLAELGRGITEANGAFCSLTDVTPGDLPLRWDAITSSDSPVPDDISIGDLLRDGGAASWETELIPRNGGRIPVLVVAARPVDRGRQYVGFVLDLTREKDLEAALLRSEERWSALWTHRSVICLSLARDGSITTINASGAERLGYSGDELVGTSVFELLHQQDRGLLRELLAGESLEASAMRDRDLRLMQKDGAALRTRGFPCRAAGVDDQTLFLVASSHPPDAEEDEERLLAYQMRLRTLTLESALAEERQRRRIALGLHDDVGHTLALARMKLVGLHQEGASPRELGAVRTLIDQAIGSTRALTFELSPPTLYELGLEPALQGVGERLADASGIRFTFVSDDLPKPLSPEASILLYRSVYELLRNVVKHASAAHVGIDVAKVGNRIEITVSDDGVGFDPAAPTERRGRDRGYGLFSIREQLRAIGGHFDLDTAPGRGTRCLLRALLESPAV